ncbi:hypothetical protein BDW02DRAFT_300313 [Decorospora gaudefroyi]|uniref:Uncharacterized protein n=1 Tax=Decorospora gaudefroyi TaxID=184978 RepID=A0A6A5KHH3_9PLEO|nr:hypothetical protein BDW02DRAFT_300313 [Decorospora gaudefroyi]
MPFPLPCPYMQGRGGEHWPMHPLRCLGPAHASKFERKAPNHVLHRSEIGSPPPQQPPERRDTKRKKNTQGEEGQQLAHPPKSRPAGAERKSYAWWSLRRESMNKRNDDKETNIQSEIEQRSSWEEENKSMGYRQDAVRGRRSPATMFQMLILQDYLLRQ